METIKIVEPIPNDVEGMINVYHKTWLQTYPNKEAGITVDDVEDSYKDSYNKEHIAKRKERIAEGTPNQKTLIAKEGNLIIGCASMVRNPDNNQLRTIYILPEFQGKGIGKRLWNALHDFCDPSKDIIVQVATYNEQAISFYKKLGFVDTGKRFSEERFKMKSGAIIPEMELVIKA